MHSLQATWVESDRIFFWSSHGSPEQAAAVEFPVLGELRPTETTRRLLRAPGRTTQRVQGFDVELSRLVPVLAVLHGEADLSDSLRVWAAATKLGLELAARKRVVPTVEGGLAHWKALVSRRNDRERFEALVRALPVAARAIPVGGGQRTPVRLRTADAVVRDYIDAVVDAAYRTDSWPGAARGWVLELAEALRGADRSFAPREARHQAIPEQIRSWVAEAEDTPLRVGIELRLPEEDEQGFGLHFFLHPVGAPSQRVPVSEAWHAGANVLIDGHPYGHPAHAALRGLARAAAAHPPLGAALEGSRPRDLRLNARELWSFLADGAPAIDAAGMELVLPEGFDASGDRRIRARMRVGGGAQPADTFALDEALRFEWEIVVGDLVLTADEFAELTQRGEPVVRFRGRWVLLDPKELARLPSDLNRTGELPAADALRAVLFGEHEGVPVVADDRLGVVIEALRHPPVQPLPEGLRATLRPYQARGYDWLVTLGALGLGCCLADDMGLGKTVQLIAYLLSRKQRGRNDRPSLVVCPASVLGNWCREIDRFAPGLVYRRHHGLARDIEDLEGVDVVLTTWGLLVRDAEAFNARDWDLVALDEAQAIKNPDARRARVARDLKARHRVALTGTPVENRLEELWSLMQFLVPGLLGPRERFRRNVAIPVERFGDEEVARRLRLGVSPFLLRRLKTDPDVISDLPEKIERSDYVGLNPEQVRLYRRVTDEALARIAESEAIERRGRVLALITALKQVCNHPEHYLKEGGRLAGRSGKLDRCVELLEAIFERGERALIFTQYREMGELLQTYLEEHFGVPVPFLHGGTPLARRDAMVAEFQTDDHACPVLIISLRAGGTGLNLTRASHVIHYDRWWNPAVEDQATDRAFRIGQLRNVQVHKLVCQGTLEERVDTLLQEKRALAESIVGNTDQWVGELDDEALRQLVLLSDDAIVED